MTARDDWRTSALESVAALLLPHEPAKTGRWIAADRRWRWRHALADEADAVVWGRAWTQSGTPPAEVFRQAAARERALVSLRRLARTHARVAVHRLPPPSLGSRHARSRARTLLMSGALVEIAREVVRRNIDAAFDAAGVMQPLPTWRFGSGGRAIARCTRVDGRAMIFRAARAGAAGDPERAARALEHLAAAHIELVPESLSRGHAAGASWATESVLLGGPPRRLDAALAQAVSAFCARLPATGEHAQAWTDDLEVISSAFPRYATMVERLERTLAKRLSYLPGVLRHGDLWTPNLLVHRRMLTGILDWDAWHRSGVPGTDLVYLYVSEMWRSGGRSLADAWIERPWRSAAFADFAEPYWRAMQVSVDAETLDAVGTSAWAAQISGNLSRLPALVLNDAWAERNVAQVLRAFL